MRKFYSSIFFSPKFYWVFMGIILLFLTGYFVNLVFVIAKISFLAFLVILVIDFILLYFTGGQIISNRETPEKLSNGDVNDVSLTITNTFKFPVEIEIIDELPVQFQARDFSIRCHCNPGEEKNFKYTLKPLQRGEYHFGLIRVFTGTFFGMFIRRFSSERQAMVKVYPSFLQMRKYELLAVSNRLEEIGIKKIRKIGIQNEFDQVRDYVTGDDYRTMNWKATARKGNLMVNQYQDEKSQEVYCLIDMGRVMKMPFEGLTLLDYAINASLVISNIALNKHDKAGIVPFSNRTETMLQADRRHTQMNKILELLYNLETNFLEPNYELLYTLVRRNIKQRSLLVLFTNFESLPSMQRILPMLKKLARNHLLLTVFFQNTELNKLLLPQEHKLENVYNSIVAEGFIFDKKLIVKELQKNGIQALLTEPRNLNVNVINKYLEFKSIGLI
ncbi:MAG: DUF58 domain-containing protein [Bacteroidales bacterium]|nr:DUF58 domain-containing protein [Bacteroidales bacterium]